VIHSTALIDAKANIGSNVSIGPYCVIGPDVEIGNDTILESHVVVKGPTKIGKHNRIFQFASVGEDCQDKKYAGEKTYLEIGDNNVIRECVTIHRGTAQDNALTKIGHRNLFMAYAHVAHDCIIGDDNILANNATLAGHVHMGDWCIFAGMAGAHQFCKVGSHSFLGAGGMLLRDLPPYVMAGGDTLKPFGINSEGLKRRGFSAETIKQIKRAYKVVYRSGLKADEAVEELNEMAKECSEIQLLADFIGSASRGILR
jgi:UDP-N-acetylglucosamine acyltransferase